MSGPAADAETGDTAGTIAGLSRNWRRNLVFAAPADDPRARRPADIAALVSALIGVLLCGWTYRNRGGVDARLLDAVAALPSWITGLATSVFVLAGVYGLGLTVGVAVFARGRLAVARDMVLAAGIAVGGILLASYLAGSGWPQWLPEFTDRPDYPSFPVVRLASTWAAIGVAGPFLSAPLRKLGRRLVFFASIAALFMAYGTLTSVLAGWLVGVAAAAAVHLVFGSGQGIPSRARILAGLAEAGVDVDDIIYLPDQTAGATLVRATRTDGGSVLVKVYGRDAADAAFASRLWRAIWYSNESHRITASRLQLAEHEALILLVLERAGVPAMRLITASKGSTGDVLLVTEWADGDRLSDVDGGSAPVLDDLWALLARLHRTRIAHGSIDGDHIVLTADGPVLDDLQHGELLADGSTLAADRVQLVVATALDVGVDRALEAAERHLDTDQVVEMLPLLQVPALPKSLQSDVHAVKFDVDALRTRLAGSVGVPAPELVQLRRVSWGGIAMVVLTAFAAYSLITSLTEIGLDTIADQYQTAIWGWVAVAFVMAQTTNVGEYLTLSGVTGLRVPFAPTMMFRYAISFISLAVPSDAGAIAMSVRYQQKLGVSAAAAVAQGPLLTIVSKAFDVILLLVTAQFVTRTVDADGVDFGPVVDLVKVIVVLGGVAILAVAVVPKLRSWATPHLREGFTAVRGSMTDPARLQKIVVGTLLQKVLFALTLSASASAFGADLPFASAIFVNTAVSLFVGLVPVPGGIGVAESALTAGMVAVGVPPEAAFAAALTHRMVTAYIPPVFGWWASRWLTRRNYL